MYLVVGPFTLTDTSINSGAKRQTAKLPAKARRPDMDYRPRHYKSASAHIGQLNAINSMQRAQTRAE